MYCVKSKLKNEVAENNALNGPEELQVQEGQKKDANGRRCLHISFAVFIVLMILFFSIAIAFIGTY